jgi:protein-tyrosine phosphatase
MIDTHAHLLPGMDDGAESTARALAFVRQAVRQGVGVIYATPHCCDGVYECEKPAILKACQALSGVVQKENPDIRIMPGAEIRVTHDLIDRYDAGTLLTLGNAGRFILLELPPMFIVPGIVRIIRQLLDRGVTPVIAHAERNAMILHHPATAADLIDAGAVLQVTAGSLTGDFGRDVLKTARQMVETGQVFCLGSDIHPDRKYRMKAAAKTLEKWIGTKKADALIRENPEQIEKWHETPPGPVQQTCYFHAGMIF